MVEKSSESLVTGRNGRHSKIHLQECLSPCELTYNVVSVRAHKILYQAFRLSFMGNEASIAAGALQAKAKMSQALDSVDQSFQGPPVAKNNKDFTKVHQDRERE